MSDATLPSAARQTSAVALRDGSVVRVRPLRRDDESALRAFLQQLSQDTRELRYFAAMSDAGLARMAAAQVDLDDGTQCGLVATTGAGDAIVGHASYGVVRPGAAEAGFVVADDYRGLGLGTILIGQLADIAREHGVTSFEAHVLPHNHAMLSVFRDSGFHIETEVLPGEIRVRFATELTPDALLRFENRERTAAVNAVRAFLEPKSVAVIGASRRRGTISGEVLHNLLHCGFNGPVYPVNASAAVVQSVLAYPSVAGIAGPVDLAVIVVPADCVAAVVEDCGRKGVRALVIVTAGFAETGAAGRERQFEVMQKAMQYGMRVIGPNCMGIVNTDPAVGLNATFAPIPPPAGRVAFMSQSGALGLAIMDYAGTLDLGLSSFVSVGNKADISGNDLIRYWEDDANTDVILLYLESFGNPRKFSRIARRVGRSKPIIAVKSGRSLAGARATGSHTGALVAASDVNVDALFRQSGVIRTDTLEQMFAVARVLAHQRPPAGRGVAILTNAGGPAILCADTCEAEGLQVPALAEPTMAALRQILPQAAGIANPVDMIASATAAQYADAMRVVAQDAGIHALIVIFIPPLATHLEDAARAIAEAARDIVPHKPVLTVFMHSPGIPEVLRNAQVRLPSFAFPETAALALARATRYGEWLLRPQDAPAVFVDVRADEAAAIVAAALGRGVTWLEPQPLLDVLGCWGLPVVPQRTVSLVDDLRAAAESLGDTIALKGVADGLVHRSDAAAVMLSLRPDDVPAAAMRMREQLERHGYQPSGFIMQQMAPQGTEMIVGVVHDPQFGPVVACGAGGTLVELLRDVSVRLTPLASADAHEMVSELRSFPLLTGYRGSAPRDVAALEDIILRVSAMVEALPEIAELDLNPVLVHEAGASIVDARLRLAAVERAALPGEREWA